MRLKEGKPGYKIKIFAFQFLSGAIKRVASIQVLNAMPTFQFLSGAIKRKTQQVTLHWRYLFQFLSGAIKSLKNHNYSTDAIVFQFLSGAIKSGNEPSGYDQELQVSIPKWCD